MLLGNGVASLYRYDEQTRRLWQLQTGTEVVADAACEDLSETQGKAVEADLKGLIEAAQAANADRFQDLHYAYDPG